MRILLIAFAAISISSSFAWTQIGTDDMYIQTGKKLGLDGGTGNNYITQSGNIVSITENGKTVSLPSSGMMAGSSDTFTLANSFNIFTQQQLFRGPSGSAGAMNFQSLYSSPVPQNVIGDFYFQNVDGVGTPHTFGSFEVMGDTFTPGSEQGRLRYFTVENGALQPYMELNVLGDTKIHSHREVALDTNSKLSLDSGNSANYITYDGSKMKITSSGDICIGSGC